MLKKNCPISEGPSERERERERERESEREKKAFVSLRNKPANVKSTKIEKVRQ